MQLNISHSFNLKVCVLGSLNAIEALGSNNRKVVNKFHTHNSGAAQDQDQVQQVSSFKWKHESNWELTF